MTFCLSPAAHRQAGLLLKIKQPMEGMLDTEATAAIIPRTLKG